jgi:hypothetical protein
MPGGKFPSARLLCAFGTQDLLANRIAGPARS